MAVKQRTIYCIVTHQLKIPINHSYAYLQHCKCVQFIPCWCCLCKM